jgi:hypothetical protein
MFASKDIFLKSSGGGYQISRSVRLRSSASAYFNRTPASATNRKTWTWSGWVKRGVLGTAAQWVFTSDAGSTDQNEFNLIFTSSDQLSVSGAVTTWRTSTPVYRDPSAWYHIVLVVDTTQATANNRIRLYVNGVEVTAFGTLNNPTLNDDLAINQASQHNIGIRVGNTSPFDGYFTEINFIDGQALTPSSFGETNAVTGVWQPKKYAGTYGTNGFYLNFSDNSNNTATTIGKDNSGNGNNWTPNIISVTAGATYDSMLDVPTLYADGGNGRGNYAVMNPLQLPTAASTVLSNANLLLTCNSGTSFNSFSNGTMYPASGKYYAEFYINTVGECYVGISRFTDASTPNSWNSQSTYYNRGGVIQKDNSTVFSVATYTTGDTIGVAYDVDNATCAFYKNNTLVGTVTGVTAGSYTFSIAGYLSCAVSFNTGQRPFSYTPPTGFKALNTQNLPDAPIKNGASYMAATTYTGNGTTQSISNAVNGISFQPDFAWFKTRSSANNHALYDSVRGRALGLISNATNAEQSASAGNDLVSFDSNGVSLGPVEDFTSVNGSAQSIIAWQWNAGGSTVTNTSGSISAQVRANTTAGFSVVTYTGNGTNGATIGHGLGVAPQMIIVKGRSTTDGWPVYHTSILNTQSLRLNTTGAVVTAGFWNNTTAGSSVFTVGGGVVSETNTTSATYVAYCFAAVAGYSAFGKYTGNGSADGPFVFTGFRPRWFLVKRTDVAATWYIWNTSSTPYNVADTALFPNLTNAESSNVAYYCDILSNGFKIRATNTDVNASGGTYIYMAFAENPFKHSLAR